MLKIGSLNLENCLVMAPMAGITNLPFRLIVKELGAGLVVSEMVSAMGLVTGNIRTRDYLKSHPAERPLAVQIFGSRPRSMAKAAQIAVEAGADLVDINMGCPAKKVTKTGAGSSLLRDTRRVAEIVTAVRLACPKPLTVKIRAGWKPDNNVACEVARIVEDCGADAVTVHSRYASQGYSVPADWTLIGQVKAGVNIPVIGNGDVFEPSLALKMKMMTGCDGIMIGRAAVGNPWIFRQVLSLRQDNPVTGPDLSERRALIIKHHNLLSDIMGERKAALSMRGIMLWHSKGLPHSGRFRGCITKIKDLETLVSTMDQYFSSLEDEGF